VPKSLPDENVYWFTSIHLSPAGHYDYKDGRETQSSKQGDDIWTTTSTASEDVLYRDHTMDDVNTKVATGDPNIKHDTVDTQTADFCDTKCLPSRWWREASPIGPYDIGDTAYAADVHSSGDFSASSTLGDTDPGFDESSMPTEEVPEILREFRH
jgi:hypothetical protein